jgi:hypothetical protein
MSIRIFAMQRIIKTTPASNFTIYANDLIGSDIPPTPKSILLYLLSKPPSWQLKTHDLKKQLGLTAYAVKKGLRWLCAAGFAAYTRLKSGHTIWKIFDKSQVHIQEKSAYSLVPTPQVEMPKVAFEPVIEIKETEERKKPLPATLEIHTESQEQENIVVVDLVFPEKLTPVQKRASKYVIKKAPVQLQQDVLFALAYAMTQGKVKSPVAYLNGLVSRATNGTFEPIGAVSTTKNNNPIIPIWQGHKPPEKIDNNRFFADLLSRYGDKAAKVIGANSAIGQKV